MQMIEDRRTLHAIPELGDQLPKTLDYLRLKLAFLSCQVSSPIPGALCAWFDFGADSAVAFQCNTDAQAVTENTGKPYASRHPGKMHARGHDGHMAMLLELARRLDAKKPSKNILLVFAPSGSAKALCRTGIFKKYRAEAVFGMRFCPGLPEGLAASRKNEMLCRACQVRVEISGSSVPVTRAWEGLDALAAGMEFYARACAMEKALPDNVFRLLQFGKMESGNASDAVSEKTLLEGTLRTFRDETYHALRSGLVTVAKEVEDATGCTISVTMTDGNPAVLNPEPLYAKVRAAVRFRELDKPSMDTEDFAWYQRFLPGVFFFLGTGSSPELQTSGFDFNEEILLKGAELVETLSRTV